MKPLEYWLKKRDILLGEIRKLETEVAARVLLRTPGPHRTELVLKRLRHRWHTPHLTKLRAWRRSYNGWRQRAKAFSNKLKQLDAAMARLDYIKERIRIMTKTKSQLIKEDPFK